MTIRIVLKYRRLLILVCHVLLIVLSNYLAFLLRFEGIIPFDYNRLFQEMLPWLIATRGLVFVPFRLYEGLWRYTGIWDLRNIIAGVLVSSLIFYGLVRWALGVTAYPQSVFVIDSLLLICLMGGLRFGRRIYRELGHIERDKRVLIYGAGDAGEMIVRDMRNNPFYEYEPIGFVDDDPLKTGQRIHDVPVLGTRQDLPKIMQKEEPDEVLVAITRAETATIQGVVKALEPFKVPIKTLPNFRDLLDGRIAVTLIRSLAIEDLLSRAPISLDVGRVRHLVNGRRILVTGAGGSIGAELCHQIAALQPGMLCLYERYENALYAVQYSLATRSPSTPVQPIVGDVTDGARVDAVINEYRPDIVFHAAAHKHVPMMELNPCEAVKNNVAGTRIVAEASARHGIAQFVLISSDKAVNPTSVMGATKRVAELIVQEMVSRNTTSFVSVRFGNVLSSNGSVVPRFLDQIRAGGPVTVTHPEMRRYFMLIPEAAQLVLHATALARGGEVFVLEMGEQVKIVDLARNLIRLSGFIPNEEIPIEFIGLRPGEKLVEELVAADEFVEPSGVEKISLVRSTALQDTARFGLLLAELERRAAEGDAKAAIECLREIVPTFHPIGQDR